VNSELITKARKIGVEFPKILLPEKSIDLNKWSVVACDQYTSQPEYWNGVEEYVGNSPSTLDIVLPEIHLEKPYTDSKIQNINKMMNKYLEDGTLKELGQGVIYTERLLKNGKVRKGLVLCLDLERYDFSKGSKSLIRATEKTVIERIPPRIKVRNNAIIESPHILVLIDDEKLSVIEPIAKTVTDSNKVYEFDFMQNGGHMKGWHISEETVLDNMVEALNKLADMNTYMDKYRLKEKDNLMIFAMGDGNHSLATAKTHWENVKKGLSGEDLSEHPARYALIELNNLHDESLEFEAIHRVVFNVDVSRLLDGMVKTVPGSLCKEFSSKSEYEAEYEKVKLEKHIIPFVTSEKFGFLKINDPQEMLTVAAFENAIGPVLEGVSGVEIDYIHGDDIVIELSAKSEKNIGFFLPTMHKDELFPYVLYNGTLPKKTFSMGEADEKRYYLECRKIVK
jgi:uncharacterized protein (DUF1015 family)